MAANKKSRNGPGDRPMVLKGKHKKLHSVGRQTWSRARGARTMKASVQPVMGDNCYQFCPMATLDEKLKYLPIK